MYKLKGSRIYKNRIQSGGGGVPKEELWLQGFKADKEKPQSI